MHGWQFKQKVVRRLLNVTGPVLTWAARSGRVETVARLLQAHLVRVQTGINPKAHVIVLFKVGCTEDVVSSVAGDARFTLDGLDRRVVKALARAFLPAGIGDNEYLSDKKEWTEAKARYRQFLVAVWSRLRARRGPHLVVSGNFGYYAERELAGALENIGIPFVVLQKENLRPPGQARQDEVRNATRRGPFDGRMILQYNEVERQIELRSGVITPDRTRIVGMPRMDRVHQWRVDGAERMISGTRQVLFFLFDVKSGIPTLPRKGEKSYELPPEIERASWKEMQEACINAMVALARTAPDVRVVMKTKGNRSSIALMAERFWGATGLPTNFRIVVGGDPLELLMDSTVVCGFNSTALLEAIAANKPVVVPAFAEATRPDMQQYLVDLGNAVEYARSPDALVGRLLGVARSETHITRGLELAPAQKAVLERWTGNADGHSGERVRLALLGIAETQERGNR